MFILEKSKVSSDRTILRFTVAKGYPGTRPYTLSTDVENRRVIDIDRSLCTEKEAILHYDADDQLVLAGSVEIIKLIKDALKNAVKVQKVLVSSREIKQL
jgi:hypothetical protein